MEHREETTRRTSSALCTISMAEAAAANFPKLCHGSLEHVLPQKNLEKMLVGGPITKPMDLAITLCPFGPQRIALVCCGSVL